MNDQQLLRYARHVMLEGIGIEGQQALLNAHALVIGAGGLGSPAALYLGTAGVGRITVVDHDTVDLSNLQRQIAHNRSRLGHPKAESACVTLAAINPDLHLRALVQRADAQLLAQWVPQATVVLDCTDNFTTRHAINAACVQHRVPLVSGAALGWDAQISVYDTRPNTAPCYACVFPPEATFEEVACATMGVLAPLVGMVGSLQAAEAIKLITGAGQPLVGQLMMLDGRSMQWDRITLQRNAQCAVCSGRSTGHTGSESPIKN
jgi:molybdopterin-synthase adenylyltransferase